MAEPAGNRKLRVALVVGGLPFGGVETSFLLVARRLRELGHEPVIINVSGTGEYESVYREHGFDPIHAGESKKVLKTSRLDTALRLRKLLRSLKPDIVHTAHFSANYHVRIGAVGLGIPVIMHCRNIKRMRSFRRFADKVLSHATTKYLAVSKAVAEVVQQDHNVAGRPVEVLYNAISQEKMSVEAADLTEFPELKGRGPLVVTCSRLVRQKNLDLILRAFADVRSTLPQLRMLILGDGPERSELEKLAGKLGVAESICFAGFRKDVPEILHAAADRGAVFAMVSDYEGFSNALTEAMYCGMPAVISEHVPNLEVTGESALVVPVDRETIASALLKVLSDQQAYQRMSAAARTVAAGLTINAYVDRLVGVYEETLGADAG